jgi:hypothetical protein
MRIGPLLAVLSFIAPVTHAHDAPVAGPSARHALDFGLTLSALRAEPVVGGAQTATRTRRITVHWREPFGERIRLGMLGGYSYLSQTRNTLIPGRDLDGYHAGLSLHASLLNFSAGQMYLSAKYLYENARHESGTLGVRVSLDTWQAALGLLIEPGRRVQLLAGIDYGRQDGTETATGAINRLRDIEDSRSGGFAGVGLRDERNGALGVIARDGFERGVSFYFKRLF